MTRRIRMRETESDRQRRIADFLMAHGCIVLFNGSSKMDAFAARIAGAPKSNKGSPDLIVALPGGKTAWLETKSPGGKQSPAQADWQRALEAIGHLYLVVYDVKDVEGLV